MQVVELAACMCPARRFYDTTRLVNGVIASIRIGLQRTVERGQMGLRIDTLAVWRVGEPDCGGRCIAAGAIIAHIYPESPRLRHPLARRQHRYRCVIGMEFRGRHDVTRHGIDQWA